MSKIFISYRRDDAAPMVGRIYDRLVTHFGRDAVFKDVDDIPYGEHFPTFIADILAQCSVLLAFIGPRWLDAATPSGARRLDDPRDFVRVEIETALQRGIKVIPVLVQDAPMPGKDQVPESLQDVVEVNALPVHNDPYFSVDMQRLQSALERWVAPATAATQQPPRKSPARAPERRTPDARPRLQETASSAIGSAPATGEWIRQALRVGGIIGLPIGIFYVFAIRIDLLYLQLEHALGIPFSSTVVVRLVIALALASGIAGFLAARRTGLLRAGFISGLTAGLTAGLVVWLWGLIVATEGILYPFPWFLITGLLASLIGGLIGRAVAPRQRTAVPTAAGR